MINDDINLYALIETVKKRKSVVISIFLIILLAGTLITFLTKPTYRAVTSFFFPYNASGGGSSVSGLLGSSDLVNILGIGSGLTMSDYAKSILESRSVTDHILDKYGKRIFKNFDKMTRVQLRDKMGKVAKITLTKEQIIEIEVVTQDPQLSADIANEYFKEYEKFTQASIISFTKKKMLYSRQQRDSSKAILEKSESQLRKYQETHEVIDVPEETKTLIRYYADIKTLSISSAAESAQNEEMLQILRKKFAEQAAVSKDKLIYPINATDPKLNAYYVELTNLQLDLAKKKETLNDEHPEIKRLHATIADLQDSFKSYISERLKNIESNLTPELIQAESAFFSSQARADALKSVLKEIEGRMGKIPELGMEYGRLLRDVKVQNEIYLYWEMELQKSLAEESKDPTDYQILDEAVPPDHKYRPVRALNMALTLILAFIFSIGSGFVTEILYNQKKAYHEEKKRNRDEKMIQEPVA